MQAAVNVRRTRQLRARLSRGGRGAVSSLVMAVTAPPARPAPPRRARAAVVVERALAGGVVAGAVAAIAWVLAAAVFGTAFLALIVATVVLAGVTLMRGRASPMAWVALAVGWAVVLIEHWAVNGHGGVWVAAAAYVGVVAGARRAGVSRWALPLLAYPLLSVAAVVAAHEDLLSPWGVSWLWVAAVLAPVLGVRTLLAPRSRRHPGK